MNAQVERKDPKSILTEIVEDISRMMDRKMDAIKVILVTDCYVGTDLILLLQHSVS